MNDNDAARLRAYLQRWIRANPAWHQRAAEDIALELARDADFSTIRLASWLRTPDGALITQAVAGVLPYPYNYGAKVLTDAVQIAAHQARTAPGAGWGNGDRHGHHPGTATLTTDPRTRPAPAWPPT